MGKVIFNFIFFYKKITAHASTDTDKILHSSWEYRDQYDDFKQKMEEAIELSGHTFNKKRSAAQEIRQYEEQKEEATKYEKLVVDRQSLVVQYLLWKLFHVDQKSKNLIEESNIKASSKNEAEFDVV